MSLILGDGWRRNFPIPPTDPNLIDREVGGRPLGAITSPSSSSTAARGWQQAIKQSSDLIYLICRAIDTLDTLAVPCPNSGQSASGTGDLCDNQVTWLDAQDDNPLSWIVAA